MEDARQLQTETTEQPKPKTQSQIKPKNWEKRLKLNQTLELTTYNMKNTELKKQVRSTLVAGDTTARYSTEDCV